MYTVSKIQLSRKIYYVTGSAFFLYQRSFFCFVIFVCVIYIPLSLANQLFSCSFLIQTNAQYFLLLYLLALQDRQLSVLNHGGKVEVVELSSGDQALTGVRSFLLHLSALLYLVSYAIDFFSEYYVFILKDGCSFAFPGARVELLLQFQLVLIHDSLSGI